MTILDLGGTLEFWKQRGWAEKKGVQITVVNLVAQECIDGVVEVRRGDARKLSEYPDRSFDVAFSNSVIEHLYNFESQRAMASEMQRVAHAYWLQTPNFWFPLEPHFLFPGWQWLPRSFRVALIMRYRCGWRGPVRDKKLAEDLVDEVRLLTDKELRKIFPEGKVWNEKFMGLNKSFIVYGGF